MIVNGENIDEAEIKLEAERLRPQYDQYVRDTNTDGGDKQLYEWSKENVTERVLLKQEACNSKEKIPASEIKTIYKQQQANFEGMSKKEANKEIELQLKIERLIKKIQDNVSAPTAEEINKYYKENSDDFVAPEQVRVAHIEKHIDHNNDKTTAYIQILNVQESLRKGDSFEELAARHSDCSNPDIGYFARGQMVKEFEDVVFATKPGEVSDIFLTPFGYHIAKVYDKTPGGPVPIDQVSDTIAEHLLEDKQTKALEELIDGLREKAVIEEKKN